MNIAKLSSLFALTIPMLFQSWAQTFVQQGDKLVGIGAVGFAWQGQSVSLSEDGNTALLGAPLDNSDTGAAWVFTRVGGVWTQQGDKLVGSGVVGTGAQQGRSVALSGDGNTALIGGPSDNGDSGAVWVFIRIGAEWKQQGTKLVGSGAIGPAQQGSSVALSSDGNTAIVSGGSDDAGMGAAWVFTRMDGVWTQQGTKLVGSGAIRGASEGLSAVALSGDGNTALAGANGDNFFTGAAWVFTRAGGIWTQQGDKLVGSDAVGQPGLGTSVALSRDGNTALAGGYADNGGVGAAWVFTRAGDVWTQQGEKLVGSGAANPAWQGLSVALSRDGNSALIGGPFDTNGNLGAAWVFTRAGNVWTQQGEKLVGTGVVGYATQGISVALSGNGSTALVGGYDDNNHLGAAWVFTRTTAVDISIKPGATPPVPINAGSHGKISVAIISTPMFNAMTDVEASSLTFGRTGTEQSLAFCNPGGEDVNGDGLPDLVCQFATQSTGFQFGDILGILIGRTAQGATILGKEAVVIVR